MIITCHKCGERLPEGSHFAFCPDCLFKLMGNQSWRVTSASVSYGTATSSCGYQWDGTVSSLLDQFDKLGHGARPDRRIAKLQAVADDPAASAAERATALALIAKLKLQGGTP